MKIFILILLTFISTACTQKEYNVEQTEEDIAEINELREKEEAAFEAGDLDALLALRTNDFIVMPPNQAAVEGKEAVRGFISGMFGQLQMEETMVSEEIVVSGDWAFDRGTFTGSVTPSSGGKTMTLDGKYLWILKRQPDGSWKYTIQMWNNNGSASD